MNNPFQRQSEKYWGIPKLVGSVSGITYIREKFESSVLSSLNYASTSISAPEYRNVLHLQVTFFF